MANPKFTKTGTPEVTLSQAPDLESSAPIRPRQVVQRFWDGNYNTLTKSTEDTILNLSFSEIPTTDVDALVVFFGSDVVNYAGRAFSYTDENSVVQQVRYLQSNLPGIPVSPTARKLSMTLTIDRGALD